MNVFLSVVIAAAMTALPTQAQTVAEFGPDGTLILKKKLEAPAVSAFPEQKPEVRSFRTVPEDMRVFRPTAPEVHTFAEPITAIKSFDEVNPEVLSVPIPVPPPPPPPTPMPAPEPLLLEDVLRQQSVNFQSITFATGSATLEPSAYRHIEGIAAALKRDPSLQIAVIGHTDNVGSEAANQTLSERRANAVIQTLIQEHGIDQQRLEAAGYGESRPVADNVTEEGRAVNRRVELRLAE